MNWRQTLATLALAGAAALAVAVAAAATTTEPAMPGEASVNQIIDQLAPSRPTTRGLRNLVPERRQIDLVIQFDFDSAQLQSPSRPQLQRLAEAMTSALLLTTRFTVQGHTDATGSARHNDALSARRAQAVAEFLQAHGVGPDRLQAEGKGSAEPLDAARPDAPDNRRVRIVALETTP